MERPAMPDKDRQEHEPEFKVVDRRLFTSEGERREGAEPRPPEPANPPLSSQQAAEPVRDPLRGDLGQDQHLSDAKKQPPPHPSATETPGPQAHAQRGGPVTFEQLVMSLATTAMFQMGLVRNPGEEQPRVDLAGAKESIDLLDILQKKTTGNLSEEEAGLLEGSIYELRMVFVELSKAGRGR
jgi:hypothetical protein